MKLLFSSAWISIMLAVLRWFDAGQDPLPHQKHSNTLLWEVHGNGMQSPSYLFGTFHLICKDDIHFSNSLLKAIKSCNNVYMEIKLDDPSVVLGGLMYLNMKGGKKLSDLYTPKEYARVSRYFSDSLKIPLTLLQYSKPDMLVALLYPKMMNCGTPTGVEEELMKVVKADHKEIKGLETVQFQASLLDSIPYSLQAKTLLDNIDSLADYRKEFLKMESFYKNQRLDSLQNLISKDDFGSTHYDDMLLKSRNERWVSQLDSIMHHKSVFVAVGTGHLVGPFGLISLLRKKGYKVDPVENH